MMTPELERLRHSAAHILAQAVKRLWPETKLAIGPPIEEGFYYDLDCPARLGDADLPKIEQEMAKIVKANHPFQQRLMTKPEATEFFDQRGERYKLEIIQGIPDSKVSIYTDGDFTDLCEGPHLGSTGEVNAVKLLSVAGAYWRGDEKNPMLQRIYGTAFPTQRELDEFLRLREEAKRRDHRRLMRELDLGSFEEMAGAGLVFYYPKGALLRRIIEDYIRAEHDRRGYLAVVTPHLLRSEIWKRSGHYEVYKDLMFILQTEGVEYAVRPMNCPGHILIYQSKLRSYRDLPLRFFELGTVYRNEKSGVLHGLLRVRGFTQDDAHLFCAPEHLEEEIGRVVDFVLDVMKVFGFHEYQIEVSTRPAKFIGEIEDWGQAEAVLQRVLEQKRLPFEVHAGEGAFYGPKIDMKLKDALGRVWQCATIQCDFALPQRFELEYIGQDGQPHRPIMVHRAILGSIERFIGALLEHHAGALPVWLAPVQAVVIPIKESVHEYARRVADELGQRGIRVQLDDRNETMQYRIRQAQLEKVPYMLVVGERERAQGAVAVRTRGQGDLGAKPLADVIRKIQEQIQTKA